MLYIFIASAILLITATILFIFFPKINKRSWKKNFVVKFGKRIYRLADKNDYYLINTLVFKGNDDRKIQIDHLLITNKYFFVIKDYYFDGKIEGKVNDSNWIYYFGNIKKPSKTFVDNPLNINRKRISELSMVTNIGKDIMASIILVNDDCLLPEIATDNETEFIVKCKDLKKFVERMDSKKGIGNLDQDELVYTVHDIARMNLKP